ncbi:hypothetical protein SDC9_30691 [bioreactor metagenome]|uniref:Uncharacterized protein n=1 Tax=bioreactor metagenome TaxID=1076179 RepID=A0A644V080_9ZZZZ
MGPVIAKVVEVGEGQPLAGEIRQPDPGVVEGLRAAETILKLIGVAIAQPADPELMHMAVGPAERGLQHQMQPVERPVRWHDKSPPDRRANLRQRDMQADGIRGLVQGRSPRSDRKILERFSSSQRLGDPCRFAPTAGPGDFGVFRVAVFGRRRRPFPGGSGFRKLVETETELAGQFVNLGAGLGLATVLEAGDGLCDVLLQLLQFGERQGVKIDIRHLVLIYCPVDLSLSALEGRRLALESRYRDCVSDKRRYRGDYNTSGIGGSRLVAFAFLCLPRLNTRIVWGKAFPLIGTGATDTPPSAGRPRNAP